MGGGTWQTVTGDCYPLAPSEYLTHTHTHSAHYAFNLFLCIIKSTHRMDLKADGRNEKIIGLHSTYHCGAGNRANTLKEPFSTLKKVRLPKKKKKKREKVRVREGERLGVLFWALYRKQRSPNTRPDARGTCLWNHGVSKHNNPTRPRRVFFRRSVYVRAQLVTFP